MKIKYQVIVFIAILVASSPVCFSQMSLKDSNLITEFGKHLSSDLKKDNVHGSMSAAIIKNDHVIWEAAFGYASANKDMAADTGTIYRVGSITKTFTATLLMQLVEEGKIKLDDPVENYVPEVKSLKGYSNKTMITLRQLASHTSGLKREPDMPGASVGPMEQWESILLSCIPYTSFKSRPGTAYQYSNMGYALLGLGLERASGVPYIQMLKERILVPLHMDDTFFSVPENKISRLAEGIANYDESIMDKVNSSPSLQGIIYNFGGYNVPNGGIYSTPGDLAKFIISLTGKTYLLKPESLKEMQVIPPAGRNYGLGLTISKGKQMDQIGHSGGVPGYRAQFLVEQRSGYAVILMRNYNNGKTNLGSDLQKLILKLVKDE